MPVKRPVFDQQFRIRAVRPGRRGYAAWRSARSRTSGSTYGPSGSRGSRHRSTSQRAAATALSRRAPVFRKTCGGFRTRSSTPWSGLLAGRSPSAGTGASSAPRRNSLTWTGVAPVPEHVHADGRSQARRRKRLVRLAPRPVARAIPVWSPPSHSRRAPVNGQAQARRHQQSFLPEARRWSMFPLAPAVGEKSFCP